MSFFLFVQDARNELERIIYARTHENTNLRLVYKQLTNSQFHFEATSDILRAHKERLLHCSSFMDSCNKLTNTWGYAFTYTPMLSVGFKHINALQLCRNIAKKYGRQFTLDSFLAYDENIEEGEIEEDVCLVLQHLRSSEYVLDASLYIAVNYNCKESS